MPKKANRSCLYCETILEECVGAMGICPNCREVWAEEEYLEVLHNPCPECSTYPILSKPEATNDYGCRKCYHNWNKEPPEPFDKEPPSVPVPLNMGALMLAVEEAMKFADKKHGPMEDPEEGWYTAECEFTEWKKEVFKRNKNPEAAAKECIQLITMGCKWIRDCLPMMIEEKEQKDGNN